MRLLTMILLVLLTGCRHVPTRDEVVTDEVQRSAQVATDELFTHLSLDPSVPDQFKTEQARQAVKIGFENEFARATGVPAQQAGQTLAETIESLRPTNETKRAVVAAAGAVVLAIPDLIKAGKVAAEVGKVVLEVLMIIPSALLFGLK